MNKFSKYILMAGILLGGSDAYAQQIDVPLAAAVFLQTDQLKKVYEKRKTTQEKIIAAQISVGLFMEKVHDIEDRILGYMQNASGAVQNLYQLKKIAQLVAVDIPDNLNTLRKTIPDNVKNTAIVAAIPDTYKEITAEVTSLSTLVSQLVTGTNYSFKDQDKENKQNINLLNAAERYYIAQEVVDRLEHLNYRIRILNLQIKMASWRNLFYALDRDAWVNYNYGKLISERLIKDWKELAR